MILHREAAVLAMAAMFLPVGVGAQTPLRDALAQCAQITDTADRVQCYDEIAVPEPEPAPAAPAASPSVAQPDAGDLSPARRETGSVEGDSQPWSVKSTIASLERVEPTKWRVELSNGQVWRQTVGKQFLLREGDRVEIRETTWGDDRRLYVDGHKGFIQVSRLQ